MKRFDYLREFKFIGNVARTVCIKVVEHAQDLE